MKNQDKNKQRFVSKPMTMISKTSDSGYPVRLFIVRTQFETDRKQCTVCEKNEDIATVKQQIICIYFCCVHAIFSQQKQLCKILI